MSESFPEQVLWAQYYTVGPQGFVDSDGEPAQRPTAQEASRIVAQPNQMKDIAWVNFSFIVGEAGTEDEEYYPVGAGESLIATSRRSISEVVFKPVSLVIEQGRLTKHTANWVGHLATGNRSHIPDRYFELESLL